MKYVLLLLVGMSLLTSCSNSIKVKQDDCYRFTEPKNNREFALKILEFQDHRVLIAIRDITTGASLAGETTEDGLNKGLTSVKAKKVNCETLQ